MPISNPPASLGGGNTIYSANDSIPASTTRIVSIPDTSSLAIVGTNGTKNASLLVQGSGGSPTATLGATDTSSGATAYVLIDPTRVSMQLESGAEFDINGDKGVSQKVFTAMGTTYAPEYRYPAVYNASVSSQSGFSSDTYLTGSSILLPYYGGSYAGITSALKAGSMYRCIFQVVKTAAGVATPIIQIRVGPNESTADTSLCTFTWSAQTAVVDEGVYEILATFRSVGSGTSAVLQGLGQLKHRLSITGLGTGVSEPEISTSAGFDSTGSADYIGISVNGGASASWTVNLVQAELKNIV